MRHIDKKHSNTSNIIARKDLKFYYLLKIKCWELSRNGTFVIHTWIERHIHMYVL